MYMHIFGFVGYTNKIDLFFNTITCSNKLNCECLLLVLLGITELQHCTDNQSQQLSLTQHFGKRFHSY